MGRANGVEVSADGAFLFASESFNKGGKPASNVIWRYPIAPDGTLRTAARALVIDFGSADGTAGVDVDGMRLDAKGRLYVTRHGGGEVVVLDGVAAAAPSPSNGGAAKIAQRIKLPFSAPTNLEFGGPDGRTLFAVGRCGVNAPHGTGDGCVEAVRVDAPGLWWSNLQKGLPRVAAAA